MKYLLFLISSLAFALDTPDVMKAKVLKAYKNNYLVINRGLEDGIFKGEHIKLTNEQGYVSRAICVKPRMQISHCKVYRVVNPELLSFDVDYKLKSIVQSKMPKDLRHLKKVSFKNKFNDFTDEDINKALKIQNERIANFDLANDYKTSEPEPREIAPIEEKPTLMKKHFNQKKLKADLSSLKFSIFTSPILVQSQGSQYNSHIGLNFFNDGKKYDVFGGLHSRSLKVTNQYTKDSVEKKDFEANANLEVKDLTENLSLISHLSYKSQSFDGIKTPLNNLLVAPVGVKYYYSNSDTKKSFLSYAPAFESSNFDSQKLGNNQKISYIRHFLTYSYMAPINKSLDFKIALSYLPELTFKDTTIKGDAHFSFKISKDFFFDYVIDYYSNTLISKHYNLGSSDLINMFNLRYNFSL
ncbi:MAG: DUF481 domain-containing protein [Bacteriovoracaceae bacterium]|jgi:hypothetical protein|nr:DUF481 domain-containing protein [Bacteriovoracaceae bacterium]